MQMADIVVGIGIVLFFASFCYYDRDARRHPETKPYKLVGAYVFLCAFIAVVMLIVWLSPASQS